MLARWPTPVRSTGAIIGTAHVHPAWAWRQHGLSRRRHNSGERDSHEKLAFEGTGGVGFSLLAFPLRVRQVLYVYGWDVVDDRPDASVLGLVPGVRVEDRIRFGDFEASDDLYTWSMPSH